MIDSSCWLTTTRCRLRRFSEADRDWLRVLYADEDVARHIGGVKSAPQVDELLRVRILEYYDRHPGLGMWVTEERTTGQRLGFHLLNHIQGESYIQVGYALTRPAWGRGFATEVATAVLHYGFTELRLPTIVAIATLTNVASHRVLEKIGLERRGERSFAHPAYAAAGPMAWFERDAAAWLDSRPPDGAAPLTSDRPPATLPQP